VTVVAPDAAAAWPWVALALLGAMHGLNPGMGWLFAVALGMQRGGRGAVWRALLPLAAGHALAIALALAVASTVGLVVPPQVLRWIVAGALLALGIRQLLRHGHASSAGMRISMRQLVGWSFLVATAHGAGLMALPFAEGAHAIATPELAHAAHGSSPAAIDPTWRAVAATLLHSAGFLLVTGLLAVIVYERAALGLLRRAWVNLDLIWSCALIVTALATIVS
jgi:hypothetical protein